MPPDHASPSEDASFSTLPTGRHGLEPSVVADHQRARMVQAMIQLVVERGFHDITITAVCKRARVTERTFYTQFEDLEECFVAAYDSIVESYGGNIVDASRAQLPWEELLKGAIGAVLETTAEHPEYAHLILVDALTAGSQGIGRSRRLTDSFQALFASHAAGAPGPSRVSGLILRGLIGGMRDVIYNRVAAGNAQELPALLDPLVEWVLSYLPHTSLDLARRKSPKRQAPEPPAKAPPPLAGHGYPREYVRANQRQRLMDAVAAISREKGYAGITVSGVARRARVSHQTFYEHFSSREQAFLATYEQDAADRLAAAAESYRTQADWPRAVHAGLHSLLAWLEARPDHAHLSFVEFLATGAEGHRIRYDALQTFAALLAPGYEQDESVSPITSEAVAGGIFAVISEEILRGNAERLTELLPFITYIALAPFVGAQEAARIAREPPAPAANAEAVVDAT